MKDMPEMPVYYTSINQYYTVKTDKLGIYKNKNLTGKYEGFYTKGSRIWVGGNYITNDGAIRGKNPAGWVSLNIDFVDDK